MASDRTKAIYVQLNDDERALIDRVQERTGLTQRQLIVEAIKAFTARADIVARSRANKVAIGECQRCSEPVALRADGLPARLCVKHLDEDAERNRS